MSRMVELEEMGAGGGGARLAALFIDMQTAEHPSRAGGPGHCAQSIVRIIDTTDEQAVAEALERRIEHDIAVVRKIAGRCGVGAVEIVRGR
jgi:hypothetical protein